nr:hypothetical protein [Tanacetum cinerariifolium]
MVKKFSDSHSCIQSNKRGNKSATQGWIASVIKDKLKSDGDVSVIKIKKWLMKHYNVKEDSFMMIDALKEEIRNKNPESIVDTDFEISGNKKCFQRFFISLAACSRGFILGCRPCISLDGCHLKGKFTGVLVFATEASGTPDGLVISSNMQKGLEAAISDVYPSVEHRECIRHLYSNFKNKFRRDFFKSKLWFAARTYNDKFAKNLLNEMATVNEDAIKYLNDNHMKIWSRSKFGIISKCDYITNNISESFNSWIGELRYQPVINLLDAIIEKLMVRFDNKRTIEQWKGNIVPTAKKYLNEISKAREYEICRINENQAAVNCKGKRYEVILDERKCTCRVWQVRILQKSQEKIEKPDKNGHENGKSTQEPGIIKKSQP